MTVGVAVHNDAQRAGQAPDSLSELLNMALTTNTVDEFQKIMYQMQSVRRHIVTTIMSSQTVNPDLIVLLRHAYNVLNDSHTVDYQREMLAHNSNRFSINVKDEIVGLEKDLRYLEELTRLQAQSGIVLALDQVPLTEILQTYHTVSVETFREECQHCFEFLRRFVHSAIDEGRKPIVITDWDGTMKDYCSQYATNLQPIYSAVGLARFAETFTRLTAVLTAGPLHGPGILDLTALPKDGPVVFSGSWGREWWLRGARVVHEDGIPEDGKLALEKINHEMKSLLTLGEYSQFGLVGSGVQRKVDRITLGVQTVCRHVHPDLSNKYQDRIRERIDRVDPGNKTLHFDPSTELEVEIVVHNSGSVWNKANGVERLIQTVGDSLEPPGRVLICGDTASDLPMLEYALEANPKGTMSIFVGSKPEVKSRVSKLIKDEQNYCFVSCPDVIHAAIARLLRDPAACQGITQPPAAVIAATSNI